MNYSDYSIQLEDLESLNKSVKMKEIWIDFVERIDNSELKKEAENKGFELVDNEDMEDDIVAKYLKIDIPKASDELEKYIEEKLYPFIVCLKL